MLLLQIGDRPFRRAGDTADLETHGVNREKAESIQDAIALIELYDFDVVTIDLDIVPNGASARDHAVLRAVRAVSRVPIVALTTSADPQVTIRALDLGADDVLTRLCSLEETLARLRAVVRRTEGHAQTVLRWGPLELSMSDRAVRIDGAPVRLGPKEFALLELLMLKRGRPVNKTACLSHLYGVDEYPDLKTIDVIVCRLRRKLAACGLPDIVANIWGMGFAVKPDPGQSRLAAGPTALMAAE
jgi:two-component system cell cycle response regulator CtrA